MEVGCAEVGRDVVMQDESCEVLKIGDLKECGKCCGEEGKT